MIITGIFLFLLGTKFGGSLPTPIKTEVKYEGPNKITIIEDTGDDRTLPGNIPQSGPNFIQQGSNFYFNPILPPQIVERIIPTIQNCCKNIFVTKPEDNTIDEVEDKGPAELDPLIEVEPVKVVEDCAPEVIVSEVVVPEAVIPEVVVPEVVIPEVVVPEVVIPEVVIPEIVVPEVVIPEVIETVRIPDETVVQVQPLPVIPEAPELLVFVIPELPLPIAPIEVVVAELPEVTEPECDSVETEIVVPVDPVIVKEPVIEVIESLPIIPGAPELPIIAIPELPLPISPVEVVVDESLEISEPECDPVIVKEPIIEDIEALVPVLIPEAPVLPPLDFPELPLQVNALPDLIVQPVLPEVSIPVIPDVEIAAPVFLQEIDVALNEIPSLPELPPLVVVEKPNVVEDKQIILIPAPPALPIEAFVPPQLVIGNPVLPTICARNIVLDRVLPRIIFKQTRKVELIPFPSARIVPSCNVCKK